MKVRVVSPSQGLHNRPTSRRYDGTVTESFEALRSQMEPVPGDRVIVHEARNLLAVAIANVEGIIDGKFEAAPRMATLLETLRTLSRLLDCRGSRL
jgi:hypothetical protein